MAMLIICSYIQGQLPYLERALNWSSWYGLDVMMDLHGLPGGANGQDNQGYKGPIEFQLNSTNMDRAMEALANMTQYVTAEKFDGVVKAIELTNEVGRFLQPSISSLTLTLLPRVSLTS